MEAQLDDLVDVLGRGESSAPCLVVGHSYGGNVALALADRRPDLVAAVATYESPMSWLEWWSSHSAGAQAMSSRDQPERAAEQFMRRLIGDDRWDRLPPSTREARRAEGPAMLGELFDLRERAPWTAERVRVPVVAMHGGNGRPHHRRAMQMLGESIVGCEVVELPDAGHFGPNTHPDQVAELIVALAERVERSAASSDSTR
jgi:pimeloyl-ACP methyl ester carboxylesterase